MPWPVIIRRGRVIVCESQNHRAPVGRGSTFLVALPPTTKGHRCVDDASKTRPLQGPTLARPLLLVVVVAAFIIRSADHPAAAAPVVDGLVGA